MGVCQSEGRIAVCHKNIPAIISKITSVMGAANINIASMSNKSRGDYAYSLLDVDKSAGDSVAAELEGIDGVIKVRIVK